MEIIFKIYLTIALIVPVLIILFGIISFICKERLIEITVKMAIAFFLHFIATIIVLIFLAIFFSGFGHSVPPKTGEPPSFNWFEAKLLMVSSLAVFCYAVFSLILCWFAKTDLDSALKIIVRKPKEMPTII